MGNTKDDKELSNLGKFIALAVVAVIAIVICLIVGLVTNNHQEQGFSCDTNYNPTPCPEPDYDKDLEQQLRQYPDDTH